MHELRHALRRARRAPWRTTGAALTLAVAAGTCAAAWAAVEGVLLRPPPMEEPDELVVAWLADVRRGLETLPFGPWSWEAVEDGATSLEAVAAYDRTGARAVVVEGPDGPYAATAAAVVGDFFGVVGARPALGRLLRPDDDLVGAEPVVVLSHRAWVARHGADPDVVGRSIERAGRSHRIVGVAPVGFDLPRGTELWWTVRGEHPDWATQVPVGMEWTVLARVRAGVSPDVVAADLARAVRAAPGAPAAAAGWEARVTPLEEHVVGSLGPVLQALLAAAALLLLAASANAALLLLGASSTRQHEITVHRALGAGRSRIVGRVLADGGVVGGLAAAGALVLAWALLRALPPLAPEGLPRIDQVRFGAGPAAGAVLAAWLAGAGAALVAGSAVWTGDLRDALRGGVRGGVGAGGALGRWIAGAQVALAVTAGVGAGLLARSVWALTHLEPGLDPEGLHMVRLHHAYGVFEVPDAFPRAVRAVVDDLEARPDIRAARPTLVVPEVIGFEAVFAAQGQDDEARSANPYLSVDAVLPGHLAALGIPLVAGRAIEPADMAEGARPVVVLSESAARRLWPSGSALGGRLEPTPFLQHPVTVVGIAADHRLRSYLDPVPAAWFPRPLIPMIPATRLLVRSDGGAASVRAAVEAAFARHDPTVSVLAVEPVDDILARPASRARLGGTVLAALAAATGLLALSGVYGVFAVAVTGRRREIGVRMALGSPRSGVVGDVLAGVLAVAGVGTAVGLGVALAASRALDSVLYGVPAHDPATLIAIAAGMLVAALLAGLGPALDASSTDPASALRSD